MAMVCDGDPQAFEVIFDRHSAAAFSLAYRMCARRAFAEDIVQEAFLSLWRGGDKYDRARGSVRSWVLAAVRNRMIDGFRYEASRSDRNVSDDGAVERIEAPERTEVEVARRDQANQVRNALESLPADQRQVIEMAYFGGFSNTEIAKMLRLPAGTVKGRMRLGMSKLRIVLVNPAGALR